MMAISEKDQRLDIPDGPDPTQDPEEAAVMAGMGKLVSWCWQQDPDARPGDLTSAHSCAAAKSG